MFSLWVSTSCTLRLASAASRGLEWLRRLAAGETGAEVPEYVLVVAIIAMLAVVGLVAVKTGLLSNLNGIANCLTGAAQGTSASCA